MNRPASLILTSALLLVATTASAHVHKVVMGTVKSIDASRLEITLTDRKVLFIPLAKETSFVRGTSRVTPDQVKVGMRVVVTLAEDDKTAEKIKLGPASGRK